MFDLPCFAVMHRFGACSKKPTMFLTYGCSTEGLEKECNHPDVFWQWEDGSSYSAPHEKIVARRTGDGNFATMQAARYPVELNVALSSIIAEAVHFTPCEVLILFSGPVQNELNIAECLGHFGIHSVQVDILNLEQNGTMWHATLSGTKF